MNWNNRLPGADVGEQALANCDRLKIDVWRENSGNVVVGFELHGSIGCFDCDDDEAEDVATKEPADLSLVFDLLRRMQRGEASE